MIKDSRTSNSFYNLITGVFGQFLNIILQFVVRTVFISTLGKTVLGLSGLFSNILEMLSLAELGVGSAILFKFYKPIAENNKKKLILLLRFYKKIYRVIGIIIACIGISLIPFLKFIVNDYNSVEYLGINIVLIYLLYLTRSTISYFFLAYKSSIVKASQKEYKLNIIYYIVTILSSITQIVVLKLFGSFELYVIVLILAVVLQNFLNSRITKKLYPFIDDKCDEKLDKKEINDIFKDCGALVLYRLNGVVLKATDNIVISSFLGLNYVGLYSNYYILYTTINTFFSKIFESVMHSLGNLHVTNNTNKEYEVFKTVNTISIIVGAVSGIGIACVSDEFIKTWIGVEWIISKPFAILLGIEIYTLAIDQFLSKYRSAMGLFQQAKMRPVFGSIINITLSIILVNYFQISGVIIGTIIASWTTLMWYDPLIIFRHGFCNNYNILEYYKKNILNFIAIVLIGAISYLVCNNFFLNMGWVSVIIHSCISISITLVLYLMLFGRTNEIKNIKLLLTKILSRKKMVK